MIGRTVSHFRILEQLGAGGMGVVYLAEDLRLGRRVALKFLPPQAVTGEEERARLRREARLAASLSHPNVCTVFEIDEHEGRPFIAMELVEGRTLEALIAEGPLPLARAVDLAGQIADGLVAAHERGIVHRDLKPGNVMVTPAGRARIMDFGLACGGGRTRLTREGSTLGTVAYMAPEQARGEEVDRRADLWALGALLYEMVTGRRPFRGEHEAAVVYALLHEEPQPPTALRTGVPPELERIVLKALAKRPEDRYQHADELRGDLRHLERELASAGSRPRGATATPTPAAGPAGESVAAAEAPAGSRPRRRRGRWLLAGLGAAAALLAAYLLLGPLTAKRLDAAPRPIAVVGFENLSGDPRYDYLRRAIPSLLITSLEQSPYLRVTTWERLRDLARQAGRPDTAVIDKDLGFELCRLDGVDAIVVGSFVKAGGTFVTEAKVLDVRTKELLKSASARGEGPESILKSQVDALSHAIAEGVGLSARRAAGPSRPVADMTTSSLDAYELFVRGREAYENLNHGTARDLLERAVAIDSTFAMAHMLLAMSYGNLRQVGSQKRHAEAAARHAGRAAERERLYIEAMQAGFFADDVDRMQAIISDLLRKYPQEKRARVLLATRLGGKGRQAEEIPLLEQALALDPDYAIAHNLLAYALMARGDNEKALSHLRRYAELCPGEANPHDSMGDLYLHLDDVRAALVEYRRAVSLRPDFTGSLAKLAYFHGVAGEYDSALVWLDRFLAVAPSEGMEAEALSWRALLLTPLGRFDAALADQQRARQLLQSAQNTLADPMLFACAATCGAAGRWAEAEAWAERFAAARSDDATWKPFFGLSPALAALARGDEATARRRLQEMRAAVAGLPGGASEGWRGACERAAVLLEAEIELAAGRPRRAVELMRSRFVLEEEGATFARHMLNVPANQDVLPRALAAGGDLAGAITEYRRLLTFDPTGRDRRLMRPVYLHRLAGLLEQAGRPEEALAAEERFLACWSGADPGRPEVAEARARCERLRAARRSPAAG